MTNDQVIMLVDLTGPYIKQTFDITLTNTGSDPVSEYIIAHPSYIASRLVVAEVKDTSEAAMSSPEKGILPMAPTADGDMLKVTFRQPLEPGQSMNLMLVQAVSNMFHPYPEEAVQSGKQILMYNGPEVFSSPYETIQSELRIHSVPGFSIERISTTGEDFDKGSKKEGFFAFEPVSNIEPFSDRRIQLVYENPRPMIKTTKLTREAWVSHWGSSVSFEETYWLTNMGTKLKNSFSRAELMRASQVPKYDLNTAAMKAMQITLPPGARDAYFTDLVGNVSTSNFRSGSKSSKFELRPRYPLFGGWNYNFTIGWSHDLSTFVRSTGPDQYLMRIPILDGPVDMSYDDVDMKIILPQGAKDLKLSSPFGASREVELTQSFLDSVGRPTISLHFHNLIDAQRVGEIYVSYTYSFRDALRKPLSLAATVMSLFLVAFVSSKIDVSILRRHRQTKPTEI